MEKTVDQDMRVWANRAIALHLSERVLVTDVHSMIICRILAHLMWRWRCEVPEKWSSECGFGICYRQMAWEKVPDVWFGSHDIRPWQDDVATALERGDWDAVRNLPDGVWTPLAGLTGISKAEWDTLPDYVSVLLTADVECPDCGGIIPMADLGVPSNASELGAARNLLEYSCPTCRNALQVEPNADLSGWDVMRPENAQNLIYSALGIAIILGVLATLYALSR